MVSFEERWTAEHEISAIIYGYADALDTGDFERLGAYFRHARIRVNESDDVFEGTEGVLGMFRGLNQFYDGIPRTKHVTTNLVIELDDSGDRAMARSYFTVLQATSELALQPIIAGRYHDTFERRDGEWHLVDRFEYCDLIGNLGAHLKGAPLEMLNRAP
jgi:ketosteroid isomerase-like protein